MFAVVLGCLAPHAPARALADQHFELEHFHASPNPNALITVDTAEVPGHLEWNLGGAFNYAHNPLLLHTVDGRTALVGHRVGAQMGGGITLFHRIELGASAPVTALQLQTQEGPWPVRDSLHALTPWGMGDLRLYSKASLLRQEEHFMSLAVMGVVTLPTSLGLSYLGESTPTFLPSVLLSRRAWGLKLMGNLGLRLRGDRVVGHQVLGDEVFYKAGVAYDFGYHSKLTPLMPFVEMSGVTGLVSPFGLGSPAIAGKLETPLLQNGLELNGGVALNVGAGLQWVSGVSWGILPGAGTPDFRAFGGLRYEHTVLDKDGDGIPDAQDRCPNSPEDRDGFEDQDGCPDPDNDQDGIPDVSDHCPNLAEDRDGFEDDDGCPDPDNDGDGVLDAVDACPNEAGPLSHAGCPVGDEDGDGIPDDVDLCPSVPEDLDGFEDEDGCPDPDNDHDGVVDAKDRCPFEAEDVDGFEDDDGCPDPDNDKDTVPDEVDDCPNVAAPPDRAAMGEGCPDEDQDGDHIPDSVDLCPNSAEDLDGFEDGDGCPEPDNDRDGVPDEQDQCPNEPETINGFQDQDGCPDVGPAPLVTVTAQRLELGEKVYFDTGKATIQRRSWGLLNQVALTLLAHPELTRVAVAGHTDAQGGRLGNTVLSQKRAEAVCGYLLSRGVSPSVLTPQGYGPDQPLAPNTTAAGRERNRRVEFVIEERQGAAR